MALIFGIQFFHMPAVMLSDESDARDASHSKALRAKSMKAPVAVSRQLWECVRVLAPLFAFLKIES
jgi:hypothetical protein